MNIYDTANRLSSEIKSSEEYANFKMAREVINLRPDLKEEISKFEQLRYEVQINQMQTGKADEEKMKQIQEIYSRIIEIDEIKKYFDAELKFNVLLADVNKIIGDAVKDLV
jgi:cell fate (sporulation/competence/biofilm development) regulator YlbF (YheA/YmcA/DUF963 family)